MSITLSELKDRTDIGTIIAFGGHVNPEGYLECDGATYNIQDKLALYLSIGLTYGGSCTGLPADLSIFNVDTVTVINKSSTTITVRLHRERGILGMPTLSNNGIVPSINGDQGTSVSYATDEMNTGVIILTHSDWSAYSWYASFPSSGTHTASGLISFTAGGSGSVSNTGFAGTFKVPNLNDGETCLGGNSSNIITSNVSNRTENVGSNNHTLSGLSFGTSGNATMNVTGSISASQNVAKPNATITLSNTTITNNMMAQHKHMVLGGGGRNQRQTRRYRQGTNSNRNAVHMRVRRSGNQSNDQTHATGSAGSNNNNKHNHTISAQTNGNLTCGVGNTTTTGNFNSSLSVNSDAVSTAVKSRTINVKYLIKEF